MNLSLSHSGAIESTEEAEMNGITGSEEDSKNESDRVKHDKGDLSCSSDIMYRPGLQQSCDDSGSYGSAFVSQSETTKLSVVAVQFQTQRLLQPYAYNGCHGVTQSSA